MEKLTDFIHFEQKNTHISGCKIVHKCVIATVTMHICTVTIACAFNILIIFYSLLFFSLFSICKTNPPSHVLSSSNTHTPTDTKSKINYKNQKSTTKKKKNQPLEKNHWIGDQWSWIMDWKGDLDQWCGSVMMEISVDGDWCWWSACNGLTEKRKEKDSQKKKYGEEREAEIEIRMVWRRRGCTQRKKKGGVGVGGK